MLRMNSWWGRGLLVGALALAGAGCGGPLRYAMRGSSQAVGADANVEARVNRAQSNTHVDVRATNLPPPDRIQAGATAFVVWQRRNTTTAWVRLGTLGYDPSARTGEMLDVNVPEVRFELQVTVERDAQPAAPSPNAVFSQTVGGES